MSSNAGALELRESFRERPEGLHCHKLVITSSVYSPLILFPFMKTHHYTLTICNLLWGVHADSDMDPDLDGGV